MNIKKSLVLAAAVAAAVAAPGAFATNGYFHTASAPRPRAWVVPVWHCRRTLWRPRPTRRAWCWWATVLTSVSIGSRPCASAIQWTTVGSDNIDYDANSDSNDFYIPEFGYNKMISSSSFAGLSWCMARRHEHRLWRQVLLAGRYRPTCSVSEAAVHCADFGRPKSATTRSVFPLNIARRPSRPGVCRSFDQRIGHLGNVTDKGEGFDRLWAEARLDRSAVAKLYAGRDLPAQTNMSKFGKYKGLFAEQGDFRCSRALWAGSCAQGYPGDDRRLRCGEDQVRRRQSR